MSLLHFCPEFLDLFPSRFSPTKRSRAYSTGAIYVTILNNPRSKRFLPQETILYCVIPGPHEPTLEQLNQITEPLCQELQALYKGQLPGYQAEGDDSLLLTLVFAGVHMRIYGQQETEKFPVNGMMYINTSDIPASRKASGLRGIKSEDFMCTLCYQPFSSLVSEDCFNRDRKFFSSRLLYLMNFSGCSTGYCTVSWSSCLTKNFFYCITGFTMRDDHRFLKYAYRWRDAGAEERQKIEIERGVSWTTFDALPGWIAARDHPIDFMHAVFLGQEGSILPSSHLLIYINHRRSQTYSPTNLGCRGDANASESNK